jgi:membrane associated rhomboid family serine protease
MGPSAAASPEPAPEQSETLEVSTSLEGVLPIGLLSLFLPLAIMPYGSAAKMRRDAGPWQARAWYANLGLIVVTGVISAVALVAMLLREVGVLRYFLWSGESFRLDQLVTSLFIHAGIAHFLGNIVFLWVFGNMLSTAAGIVRYPIAYIVLGVLAGYFGHVLAAEAGVDVPCVGASGAIMGLAGTYLVLFARGDVYMAAWFRLFWLMDPWVKEFKMKGVWAVLFFIAFDVAAIVLGWTGTVAHGVHLAGFVGGLALGFALLLSGAVRSEGHDLLTWLSGGRWRQRGAPGAGPGTAEADL